MVARTRLGRVVSIAWICVSLVVMSVLSGSVASALTVEELTNPVNGPADLRDKSVASPAGSTAASKAVSLGAVVWGVPLEECFRRVYDGVYVCVCACGGVVYCDTWRSLQAT